MSEIRKDPVTGRWVVIDGNRPLGQEVSAHCWRTPPAACPFCMGHEYYTPPEIMAIAQVSRQPNGQNWDLRVFPNRFPLLRAEEPLERRGYGIYDTISGAGAHEIVITTPKHERVLSEFTPPESERMFVCFRDRLNDLYRDSRLRYVSVFTSQGRRAGATLSHPHSQIVATPMVPKVIKEELLGARGWYEYKERCVFCDIIRQELSQGERIVATNSHFVALCPYASRYPFETWILPLEHQCSFGATPYGLIGALGEIVVLVARGFQNLLLAEDLYLAIHTAPNQVERPGYWKTLAHDFHWHIEMYPALLRNFGLEWSTGCSLNPTPPEQAALALAQAGLQLEQRP